MTCSKMKPSRKKASIGANSSSIKNSKSASPQIFSKVIPFNGHPRLFSVSVALPSSIMCNAQNPLLKAYLVGQIARSLTIFGIDEIILYDDLEKSSHLSKTPSEEIKLFINILQYLETPQYLRKYIFPLSTDFKYAGLLSPIDAPHHLRKDEWLPYREGIVTSSPLSSSSQGSYLFCGFDKPVHVKKSLPVGLRCTIRLKASSKRFFDGHHSTLAPSFFPKGKIVSPSEPPEKAGLYWGYKIKAVSKFLDIFENISPTNKNKYDLVIGTSQNGDKFNNTSHLPKFKNLLIVMGGKDGLEPILEKSRVNISDVFDSYINICPFQKSRTIRTEEALPIILSALHPHLVSHSESI